MRQQRECVVIPLFQQVLRDLRIKLTLTRAWSLLPHDGKAALLSLTYSEDTHESDLSSLVIPMKAPLHLSAHFVLFASEPELNPPLNCCHQTSLVEEKIILRLEMLRVLDSNLDQGQINFCER